MVHLSLSYGFQNIETISKTWRLFLQPRRQWVAVAKWRYIVRARNWETNLYSRIFRWRWCLSKKSATARPAVWITRATNNYATVAVAVSSPDSTATCNIMAFMSWNISIRIFFVATRTRDKRHCHMFSQCNVKFVVVSAQCSKCVLKRTITGESVKLTTCTVFDQPKSAMLCCICSSCKSWATDYLF